MAGESGEQGVPSRRAAAQLIGALPDYFEPQLAKLLADKTSTSRAWPCARSGTCANTASSRSSIERLEDPSLSDRSRWMRLQSFENSILDTLRGYLDDSTLRIEIRRRIPEVLLQIGTRRRRAHWPTTFFKPTASFDFGSLSALNKLQELHKHPPLDRGLVETVMVAEIMGHYRSYQILGSLKNHADELLRQRWAAKLSVFSG